MSITKSVLDKYGLPSFEQYRDTMLEGEREVDYYYQFLRMTDHIPNKIIEAQVLGEESEDYTEILKSREFASNKINKLHLTTP